MTLLTRLSRPRRSSVRNSINTSSSDGAGAQRTRGGAMAKSAGTAFLGCPAPSTAGSVLPAAAPAPIPGVALTEPIVGIGELLSRASRRSMTLILPSTAAINCWRSRPASGGEPNVGTTTNVLTARRCPSDVSIP
ncbi:Uncharacterised protein [Mycobacteroides abscessus subsp. abscessus]|nr:Uncharacterised protein [Mycobacteroides abscessus subsp. abscessus]